jgi:hypothetical protein
VNSNNEKIVLDIYSKFKSYKGSEHIATISSMMNLLEIIQTKLFREVLDFGAGIGTISALVLGNTTANITAVEKNAYCANEFKKHLLPNRRINLCSSLPKKLFDLCIIDDSISVREIMGIFSASGDKVVIFIEGRRGISVAILSLLSMFHRYSGEYFEGKSGWNPQYKNLHEKAGSYFIFTKSSLPNSVKSWLKRLERTDERNNLKYFLLKKSKLLGIINKFR